MDAPTALDLLISKALDGEAAPPEWDALESLARRDGASAAELVRGLRAQSGLERALGSALEGVDAIGSSPGHLRRLGGENPGAPARGVGPRLRAASGWLAAGLLACLWLANERTGRPEAPQAPLAAGTDAPLEVAVVAPPVAPPVAQAPEAQAAAGPEAAHAGEAVGELPLLMVDSRPLEDGGYEVLYMRRTLERARVDELLELEPGELVASAKNEVY